MSSDMENDSISRFACINTPGNVSAGGNLCNEDSFLTVEASEALQASTGEVCHRMASVDCLSEAFCLPSSVSRRTEDSGLVHSVKEENVSSTSSDDQDCNVVESNGLHCRHSPVDQKLVSPCLPTKTLANMDPEVVDKSAQNSSKRCQKILPDFASNSSPTEIGHLPSGSDHLHAGCHDADEESPVACRELESSSSMEPVSNRCCDWIRMTTKQERLILFCLFMIDFTSQMCLSIMAPFFPEEASNKGVSNTVSGWIFGIFSLVQVVFSPIFGKLIPVVGSRFLITAGQFFSSGCVILFGILDYIEPEQSDIFVSLCFVLRIVLAIGCTAATTASFTLTAICFPNSIATIFGCLETATGLGMMLGPALGGFLNEIGGFMLSFIVLGGFMLLTVPINICCLPADDELPPPSQAVSLWQILRIPSIIVVNLGVVASALVWSILDPTLSAFLNSEFQLSSMMMGFLFLLMSSIYAVSAPLWGRWADSMNDSLPLMVGGFVLSAVGLMLLGPSPIFQLDCQLWIIILSLIILGASVSLALVPTFDKILDTIEKAGFKDDLPVYSFVAGIWSACFALGDFIGPSVGGWLYDTQGFGWAMTYTSASCAVMAVVILGLIIYERRCRVRQTETDSGSDSEFGAEETFSPQRSISDTTPLLVNSYPTRSSSIGFSSALSSQSLPRVAVSV